MKQRILTLITILTGAAAGTAVTAVNIYLRRKTNEAEKDDRQNLDTASKLIERADLAQKQSFLLQKNMLDFAELSDADKEKVKVLVRKLAREEKDGSDIPAAKQTSDEIFDCKTEDESESATLQTKSEDEKEKERLMAEYWRRAKNIYGHGDLAHGFAKNAKPVCQSHTGYAYISVADAAKKTGYPVNYIRYCCNITDPMGKMFFSEEEKGGMFYYISQTAYAKIPEDRIEVDPREQKTEEKKGDDIALTVTPQEETEIESITPQAKREEKKKRLVAEYLRRVENVCGHSKESRAWAPYARPIRNTQTGYAYISITDAANKTGLSARDIHSSCVSNGWQGGEWRYISQTEYAKLPEEQIEVDTKEQKTEEEKGDDITPAVPQAKDESESDIPQETTEDKNKKERLMAEYWRRAKKVYGCDNRAHGWAKKAKPVYHARTGYAYIGISDASKKTGYSPIHIHRSCLSNNRKGGAWCYISQTEYAKMPEEMTEVEANIRERRQRNELHNFLQMMLHTR